MAAFNDFDTFLEKMGQGAFDFRTTGDVVKFYLSNTVPSASLDSVKTDLAEITNQNGYTAPVDIENDWSQTGGTASMTAVDKTVTASGGTVGPFQYVVLYDDTDASDSLIGWYDYTSAVTLQDGESFTVDFGANVFSIAF